MLVQVVLGGHTYYASFYVNYMKGSHVLIQVMFYTATNFRLSFSKLFYDGVAMKSLIAPSVEGNNGPFTLLHAIFPI